MPMSFEQASLLNLISELMGGAGTELGWMAGGVGAGLGRACMKDIYKGAFFDTVNSTYESSCEA